MHILTGNIKSTDTILFELNFTSLGDPWTDRSIIAEDSAGCAVTIQASDNRFWQVTTYDKYYKCSDNTCSSGLTKNDDSTNNWESFDADDDPDDTYCTRHTDTDNFQCSALKCKYRRQMITDDDKDFWFYPTAPAGTGDDTMVLSQNRQFLYFNQGTDNSVAGNPLRGSASEAMQILIVSGALALVASSAALISLATF